MIVRTKIMIICNPYLDLSPTGCRVKYFFTPGRLIINKKILMKFFHHGELVFDEEFFLSIINLTGVDNIFDVTPSG